MAEKNPEYEYVAALQDFSKSLKYFVDAIKNQVEGEKNNFKDSVEATKEQAKMMMEMAEELKVVSETTSATKSNTEQILNIVKGIKQEKKKGIWDKLSGAKDKTKSMAEGIKTIALMAGAILAIGGAFKIIGEVDFTSVLALSIALPLMATAFNMVGESVSDPKEAVNIAFSMIIMSAGVTASGAIISMMPALSMQQMISVVAVSVAMSAAMFGLAYAADKLSINDVLSLAAISFILPGIAWGIVKSAQILKDMPEIGLKQILSAGSVGVAMGLALIPLAYAADLIGDGIIGLGLMIPILPGIAWGIVKSAQILKDIPDVDVLKIIKSTLGITAATVIFGAGLWALDKLGVTTTMVVKGVVSMIAVAGGILATSHILAKGNYTNAPSLEWSLNTGVALLGGGLLAAGMGLLIAQIIPGIFGMLAVAGGIMATSHILAKGNYTNAPSLDWALGAGAALGGFALSSVAMGFVMLTGVGALALVAGMGGMLLVAGGLVEISKIVKNGTYTGGPSKEWAEGIGLSLMYFSNALNQIKPNVFERLMGDTMEGNMKGLISLGGALHDIGTAVGKDKSVYTGGPDKRWAEGVGLSLTAFASALDSVKPGLFDRLFGDTLQSQIDGMIAIAGALPKIGQAVGKDTSMYTGGPSEAWAKGVGGAVSAFAVAMAAFSEEDMELDDIMEMIPTVSALAPLMAFFGKSLSGVKFDNYPSVDWVDGITKFMESFSELDVVDDAADAAKQIMLLSKSYVMLAKSIGILGTSLQSIKTAPDLTGIYGGLVTMSLIDSDNLSDTLDVLNEKKDEFQSVLGMIQAQSSVKIDENSFAFNKDKSEAKSNNNNAPAGVTPKVSNAATVKAQPKPAATVTQPDKQEKLLNQLVQLMGQMNGVLGEIADNTSQKIHESSIISN